MEKQQKINQKAKYYVEKLGIPIIPVCPHNHEGVYDNHKTKCNNPGKVPLIKNWTQKGSTTSEDLDEWVEKFKYFNVGLLMGQSSGIIGIDVDGGKEGLEILHRMSDGELPPTWKFKTPGGGLRLLYKIPDELKNGVKFKKYAEMDKDKEHVGCELLGDGQMSVMPPSIHKNGGTYKWIKGYSPKKISIADAPRWVIEKMVNIEAMNIDNLDMEDNEKNIKEKEQIKELCKKCSVFRDDLKTQIETGVDEDRWFLWISLLVNANKIDLAKEFSKSSVKHDGRSESRIDELIRDAKDNKVGMTRCSTLGCNKEQIAKCFENLRYNEINDICNSPGLFLLTAEDKMNHRIEKSIKNLEDMFFKLLDDKFIYLEDTYLDELLFLSDKRKSEVKRFVEIISKISGEGEKKILQEIEEHRNNEKRKKEGKTKLTKKQQEDIGFIYDKNGNLTRVNGNKYAKHIRKNFDFVIFNEEKFYEYEYGVWREIKNLDLSKKLRDFLHQYEPDSWTEDLEQTYLKALKREIPHIKEMNTQRQYINLKNGLLNLDTFKLESHKKKVYSTIQIPIEYDPKIKCPQFKRFLKDIFEGDKKRAMLVLEMLGYCLTTDTQAQKGFILLGDGANGKSVLAEIMINLCGKENISSVSMKDLENPFARFDLVDKTLNISTENEIGNKGLDTQYLKAIITGDTIRVERKYEHSIQYRPVNKMVFAVNRLPYSRDKSYGFLRRLIIIPFYRQYKLELTDADKTNEKVGQADPNLISKLMVELPGILNLALLGLRRLRKNGYRFTKSEESKKVFEEYKEEINVVLSFVRENIIATNNPNDRVARNELRNEYNMWCESNYHAGAKDMNNKRFWKEIRSALDDGDTKFGESKSNGIQYITGIKLVKGINKVPKYLEGMDIS